MSFKSVLALVLLCGLWPAKASADNRFIFRTTLGLQTLQTVCNPPLLPPICMVVRGLGDPQDQVFLLTSSLDLDDLLNLLGNPLGIVDAEVDQLLNLFPVGSLNGIPSTTDLISDRTPVHYPDTRGTVWNGYANQPAAQIVRVSDAQSQFGVTGSGIVADIDTGVDPTHPALKRVLLRGTVRASSPTLWGPSIMQCRIAPNSLVVVCSMGPRLFEIATLALHPASPSCLVPGT